MNLNFDLREFIEGEITFVSENQPFVATIASTLVERVDEEGLLFQALVSIKDPEPLGGHDNQCSLKSILLSVHKDAIVQVEGPNVLITNPYPSGYSIGNVFSFRKKESKLST